MSLRLEDKKKITASDTLFAAVIFTLFLFDISGLIRQEVARVWLIFTPLLIVSIADFINRLVRDSRLVFPVMATLMFVQTVFSEIFLDTLW